MKMMLAALFGLLMLFALGCASIVAPGQDRAALEESGGTKWAIYEYESEGSRFVWIPHWSDGLLHISSPKATPKDLDVLEFSVSTGKLVQVHELGRDRDKWAEVLRAHGQLKPGPGQDMDPLYSAVALRIILPGAPLVAVLFADGFPHLGPNANPHVFRTAGEINQKDDALYYFENGFGRAHEIVIHDGKVVEMRPAAYLSKDWIPWYHPIILP